MKTWTLHKKIFLGRPQTTFLNDGLHALELAGHEGMVFKEIEQMRLAIWKHAIVHA